jgi:hypothetical protein
MEQVLQEEARAGWSLVEKFDNQRIRLKRPHGAKASDQQLSFDPYRTTIGMSEGRLALVILSIVFISLAVLIGIIALLKS